MANTSVLNYNDENALSCVITLAYYHAVNDYTLIREMPAGQGHADIIFLPGKYSYKPAMIVELKNNKSAKFLCIAWPERGVLFQSKLSDNLSDFYDITLSGKFKLNLTNPAEIQNNSIR